MELTPRSRAFTKKQINDAWTFFSSPHWINKQAEAFIELECLMSLDNEVEMPVSEIAEKTGLSEEVVRDTLNSAINKIRKANKTI